MAVVGNFILPSLLCLFIITNIAKADMEGDAEALASNSDGEILKLVLSKIEDMQAKIKKLEKSESSLKQSVGVLIGTTAQFRLRIADLTKKLEEFERSDREKEERIQFLENELGKNSESDCDPNVDEGEADGIGEWTGESTDEEKAGGDPYLKRDVRQTPERVAFSAYLDHVVRALGKDQPIVYNKALMNEAGAYSIATGIFRVPVNGVYLFSWSITARKLAGEKLYDIWVKLVVNGNHKLGTVAESRVDTEDNQSSNTVVLSLNQGDEVWTVHYAGTDIFGADSERTTSFTGVLLYMD